MRQGTHKNIIKNNHKLCLFLLIKKLLKLLTLCFKKNILLSPLVRGEGGGAWYGVITWPCRGGCCRLSGDWAWADRRSAHLCIPDHLVSSHMTPTDSEFLKRTQCLNFTFAMLASVRILLNESS